MSKYIKIGPVADSIPFDDENCPIGETVQEAIETLCKGPLVSAECLPLAGGCFMFKNIETLYSQDGCTLLQTECEGP